MIEEIISQMTAMAFFAGILLGVLMTLAIFAMSVNEKKKIRKENKKLIKYMKAKHGEGVGRTLSEYQKIGEDKE